MSFLYQASPRTGKAQHTGGLHLHIPETLCNLWGVISPMFVSFLHNQKGVELSQASKPQKVNCMF